MTATAAPPESLEQYRVELTAYCYRMLGSSADAEDAVQDTMVRAWRSFDRFEGRSSVRSWLYKIATNVCLTMLESRQRRARPMDFGSPYSVGGPGPVPEPKPEISWLEPIPDARVLPQAADPAELAVAKESVRLAFVAALQHLPARQRAVLILREVLQWKAAEVAELLDTSVASVNSALQRARATLAESDLDNAPPVELDEAQKELVARYAEVFERYDVGALVTLLHEDVILNMPPYDLWLQGPGEIAKWWVGPGAPCAGSRLVPLAVNGGMPAFGQWRPNPDGSGYYAWAVQVLELRGDKIAGNTAFLDVETLFPMFGLPLRLDASGEPLPDSAA